MTTLWSSLDKNWRDIIAAELDRSGSEKLKQLLQRIERFLQSEKAAKHTVYPKYEEIFNALNLTAFDDVKVVILGQDPYHANGQAHGLCFSVPKGVPIPRSLRNIYREIDATKMPSDGDLTVWAKQGVLLLNATLTVEQKKAGSHCGKGWEKFTDAIIRSVGRKREPVVFLFWGDSAREKRTLILGENHLVLEASHPSPRAAYRSFIGCGHFKKANEFLTKHGLKSIDWQKI